MIVNARNHTVVYTVTNASQGRELDVEIGYDGDEWWVQRVKRVRLFDRHGRLSLEKDLRPGEPYEKLYRRWFEHQKANVAPRGKPKYRFDPHGGRVWYHPGDMIDEGVWETIATVEEESREWVQD